MSLKQSGIPICGDSQLQTECMLDELDQPPVITDLEASDPPVFHQPTAEETASERTTSRHHYDDVSE